MQDVQKQRDHRNLPIDKVGIKNLKYPITVRDKREGFQPTVATIDMFVSLPHKDRGTHMSRFVEMLNLFRPEVSLKKFSEILEEMKKHLNAASAHVEVTFPYFIEKKAPESKSIGLMDYTCRITGNSNHEGEIDLISEVVVPANYNSPGQIVISGSMAGIDKAVEKLTEMGAKRAIKLTVGGAFHSPLMEPARQELETAIMNSPITTPICPVYQNFTALPTSDPDAIRANLVAQLTAPVRWTQTVQHMLKDGASSFTEVGPGKVLQGLIKKVDREIPTASA